MQPDDASESIRVIRTLMERTSLYRRALGPTMLVVGALGVAGALGGIVGGIHSFAPFLLWWSVLAGGGLGIALAGMRSQAIRLGEPMWSPPARRVTMAVGPAYFCGLLLLGIHASLALHAPLWLQRSVPGQLLILHGCALHAAGCFTPRGLRVLGWLFVLLGLLCLTVELRLGLLARPDGISTGLHRAHAWMGIGFGGFHLLYGFFLRSTEDAPA